MAATAPMASAPMASPPKSMRWGPTTPQLKLMMRSHSAPAAADSDKKLLKFRRRFSIFNGVSGDSVHGKSKLTRRRRFSITSVISAVRAVRKAPKADRKIRHRSLSFMKGRPSLRRADSFMKKKTNPLDAYEDLLAYAEALTPKAEPDVPCLFEISVGAADMPTPFPMEAEGSSPDTSSDASTHSSARASPDSVTKPLPLTERIRSIEEQLATERAWASERKSPSPTKKSPPKPPTATKVVDVVVVKETKTSPARPVNVRERMQSLGQASGVSLTRSFTPRQLLVQPPASTRRSVTKRTSPPTTPLPNASSSSSEATSGLNILPPVLPSTNRRMGILAAICFGLLLIACAPQSDFPSVSNLRKRTDERMGGQRAARQKLSSWDRDGAMPLPAQRPRLQRDLFGGARAQQAKPFRSTQNKATFKPAPRPRYSSSSSSRVTATPAMDAKAKSLKLKHNTRQAAKLALRLVVVWGTAQLIFPPVVGGLARAALKPPVVVRAGAAKALINWPKRMVTALLTFAISIRTFG